MDIICYKKSGFSLIELLVALAVLALVAAIVVPKFLNVRQQAGDVVAQQMAAQLNRTYAEWVASGGTVGSNVATSDLLYVLGSAGGVDVDMQRAASANVKDSGSSNTIRANLPAEVMAALPGPGVAAKSVVTVGDSVVYFNAQKQQFSASAEAVVLNPYAYGITPTSNPEVNLGAVCTVGASFEECSGDIIEEYAEYKGVLFRAHLKRYVSGGRPDNGWFEQWVWPTTATGYDPDYYAVPGDYEGPSSPFAH